MEFNRDNILNKSTTAKKAVVMDEGLRACLLYTSDAADE